MKGYIKLHRKIQDHWLYQEKRKFSKYEAWIDMLMLANHKDNKFLHGNELMGIERGQFVTSIRKLGERWKWSNTKVSQFLDLLKDDEMISYKKDTKRTVITIGNYGIYHDKENEKKTPKEHEKDTDRTQKHTNKNVKNVKNVKEVNTSCPKSKIYDEESIHYKLAYTLYNAILENNPNHKKPNLQKWSDDIRKMIDLDNRTEEQIRYLIDWSQKDPFWSTNILSPVKLRKQYDQLVLKVKQSKKTNVVDYQGSKAQRNISALEEYKRKHGSGG